MSAATTPAPKPPIQVRPTRPAQVEITGINIPFWDLINLIVTVWIATFALTIAASAVIGVAVLSLGIFFRFLF